MKAGQIQSPTEPGLSLNCDKMEHLEGEQYSQYTVERNPKAYMSMRDYRNPPWVSAPSYMLPPQYAPPPHPQATSPMEEVILNLTKLVGNFVEAQKAINAQLCQKIDTMENNVNKRIDNLQYSISKISSQQHGHQEEENLEGEWLTHQEELMQEPVEAPEELPTGEAEEGRGKEAGEEPQEPILQPIPMNLNPSATAQPQNSPLPVYILPTPAANSKPTALAPKAHASPSLLVQNIRKLVAIVRAFATTSKTQAASHIAWHNGWFGCWFGFGAPEPRHF